MIDTASTTENDEIQISDIIVNEVFIKSVKDKLSEVIRTRNNNRPVLNSNQSYKRDWHDRLTDKGVLSAEYFIKHIPDIWNKDSKNLNAETRNIILYVCNHAVNEAYQLGL